MPPQIFARTSTLSLIICSAAALPRGVLYARGGASAPAAPAPPLAAVDGDGWATEHHDSRNSGYSPIWTGPTDSTGVCRAQFFKDDPIDPSAVRFFSAGVNNVLPEDNIFIFGGTDNKLRFVEGDITDATVDEYTCDLDQWTPKGTALKVNFGVIASPTVWNTSATDERLAVASGNGVVYALNFASCIADRARAAQRRRARVGARGRRRARGQQRRVRRRAVHGHRLEARGRRRREQQRDLDAAQRGLHERLQRVVLEARAGQRDLLERRAVVAREAHERVGRLCHHPQSI
jgi:hypothetical protein